jgi:hypothetical protein
MGRGDRLPSGERSHSDGPRDGATRAAIPGSAGGATVSSHHATYCPLSGNKQDRQFTAFHVQGLGQLQWCVMSMGMRNSSQTQQRIMEQLLVGIDPRHVLCYIDDLNLFHTMVRCRQAQMQIQTLSCMEITPGT